MIQNVFIIGATGKVGKTLVNQIFEMGDTDPAKHKNPTRVVGLANSKNYLFNCKGLNCNDATSFANGITSGIGYEYLDTLLSESLAHGYGSERELIFVDVTASCDIATFHKSALGYEKFNIVTANKNPIAMQDFEFFKSLTLNLGSYGYRCSVMAGAEAVSVIQDLRDLNDHPTTITGCFSGTLGYVPSELESGKPLSKIIQEAKKLGYTEPHPRDDLNGLDVARKLLILARTAGYPVEFKDVKVEPFIPTEYLLEDNVLTFMHSLSRLDEEYQFRTQDAARKGAVLRYVARLDSNGDINNPQVFMRVGLQEVEKDSPLGSLKGTLNKINIVSRTYQSEHPYVVEAPGAGLEVTALNVRRDLLHMLQGRRLS